MAVAALRELLGGLLFPATCGGCRQRGAWLCPTCLATLVPIDGRRCRCGARASGRLGSCARCEHWPPGLVAVESAYRFEGALRQSIHRFKYHGEHARGCYLGELLAAYAAEHPGQAPVDLILPLPLHRRRERERGFNQAAILARAVAAATGVPVGEDLMRVIETRPQVGLGVDARRTNVAGAFACQPDAVRGARVLIVDDVITTGATLEAAARAVLQAGALTVRGLSLARGGDGPHAS